MFHMPNMKICTKANTSYSEPWEEKIKNTEDSNTGFYGIVEEISDIIHGQKAISIANRQDK